LLSPNYKQRQEIPTRLAGTIRKILNFCYSINSISLGRCCH
jgi:hypothetical protein